MALNIKHPEADRLARALARTTGESITDAVLTAIRERLQRETGRGDPDTVRSLPPGTYQVTARRNGYEPRTQTLEVKDDGKPQALTIQLALATGDTPRPGRWGWKKYAIGGAGVASLITGLVLIGMDGNPTCDAPNATCPEEYATGTAGVLFTIVGVAGAGVSGWMFWSERKDRQESAMVAPTPGGAVASYSIRF